MKTLKFLIFIISIASIACERETETANQAIKSGITAGMPGNHIVDMQIDADNNFYFVTQITEFKWDENGSPIPFQTFLSKKTSETGEFEILDSNFVYIDHLLANNDDNLWVSGYYGICRIKDDKRDTIIKTRTSQFYFITMDIDNIVWAGGSSTGLYKIDSKLNITNYLTSNSELPANSMNDIHIDKNNTKWIAMGGEGVLKITKDNWIFYNSNNSGISSQYIYSIVTDKEGNLWIGTGGDDENLSLMRFNGEIWETINPHNSTNDTITGFAKELFTDENKIYVVSRIMSDGSYGSFVSNVLLTYDGTRWNKIEGLPEDDAIKDLVIDDFRQKVWIRTLTKGIFELSK